MPRPHAFSDRVPLLLAVLLRVIAVALLGACKSGGGGGDKATPTPADAPADETPSDGADGPDEQTVSINQEFWYGGFHVTLGDGSVTSIEDTFTGEVTYLFSIDATFENLGPEESGFFGEVSLVDGGNAIGLAATTDIPNVPSGLSGEGTFVFVIDPDFDGGSAYLSVGSAGENQPRVPLGAGGGELVSLEPSTPPVAGEISMELLDLTFTGADLRADRPKIFTQVDAGSLALTLNFDATSRKSGNWLINPQDFALVLPSGSAVGVDDSMLASLPGSDAGSETADLYVTFLVDDPPAGDYTLRFSPGSYWVGEDGVTDATLEFSLT